MRWSIILFMSLVLFHSNSLFAQQTLTATTPMVSPKASISQTVGITKIEVIYSRPAVRERQVWGKVVRFSQEPSKREKGKTRPWRAGANENTIITFSTDAFVDSIPIKAGSYGVYMYIQESGDIECIFSSNYQSWGSYYYDPEKTVARVNTKWQDHKHTERMKFDFDSLTQSTVLLTLKWGNKSIPVPIQVDIKATTLKNLQQEIQSRHMINHMGPQEAAEWCLRNDTNLEQALRWANYSISFVKVFSNLKIKSEILEKLDRPDEAEEIMKEALSMGSVFELHRYGGQMLKQKKIDQAFEIFQFNAKKHPNQWPVNYGLSKAYSAKSEFKTAIKYMNKAIENCPNESTLAFLKQKLELLKNGEVIS